jgi:cytoskeletal protein RodZ
MATVSISGSNAGRSSELFEADLFGACLRRAREQRALTLDEVSAATKVPRTSLEQLESSDLARLPAEVFVRGFIRSYARVVGLAEAEPLSLYDRAVKARTEARRAQSAKPVVDPTIAGIAGGMAGEDDREGMSSRRGMGLAVFVIILLLIATITLSLLLRRPPPSGEGLSEARPAASATGPAHSRTS